VDATNSSHSSGTTRHASQRDLHERGRDHGHRRERDAEAARRTILAAAQEVFARDGFDGARIDAIAEAAGYNKSLIFQYYGDKLGLYQAVVARMKGRVEDELRRILAPYATDERVPDAPQVRRFVEETMRWSFEFYRAHPCARSILIWETAEGWRTFNCIHGPQGEHGQMRWHLAAAAFLHRAQAAGVVRADLDADVLLANAMGMALFYLASLPRFRLMFPDDDFSSPAALDRAREQLVGLMLHGVMTPAALDAAGTLTNHDRDDTPNETHEERSSDSQQEAPDAN
jgi:AcrR family transcriptional regulator